jgi:general secretion pathway protein D
MIDRSARNERNGIRGNGDAARGGRFVFGPLALPGLALLLLLAGCAAHENLSSARDEEKRGHWDLAVLEYSKALALDPDNPSLRIALQRSKFTASQEHFKKGKAYRASGNTELALVELQMAVALDSGNSFAQVELGKAQKEREEFELLGRQKTPVERLKEVAKGARVQPPLLNPKSNDPISLKFAKETPIKDVYTALGKAAGINVLFDPQLKDDKITVDLDDVTLKRGLEIVMRQGNHFYKVLDESSIIIAADTPQNRKDYEDLVIKTFFLSSGDVKEVMNVLRTLIEARRIAMNPQLNAIVIRDTVDKVAVAERIVEANDKAKAEVVIDVELLQVTSGRIRDLGVDMAMSLTQGLGTPPSGSTTGWKWNELLNIDAGDWLFAGLPSFTYAFLKNNAESTLLAKPQLRITEGEKATLTIGDRVPIPTTTFNTAGTIGGNIVPITSFQYQDVGIKIDMEPRVHHNREVTLKLTIEVSQLGERISIGNGQTQPSIGTRTVTSIIRLKDGEANFLAGLLRTDKQESTSGIPFLMDIPFLGSLFSHQSENEQRKDLLLTITPHIIRMPDITEEDLLPIWVGTENNVTFQGTSTRIESPSQGTPFDEARPLQPAGTGKGPRPIGDRSGGLMAPGGKPLGSGGGLGPQGGVRRQGGGSGTDTQGPGGGGPVQPPADGEKGGGAPVESTSVPASQAALDGSARGAGSSEGSTGSTATPRESRSVPVLRLDLPSAAPLGADIDGFLVLEGAEEGLEFKAWLAFDPVVLDLVNLEAAAAVHGIGGHLGVERLPGKVSLDWKVGVGEGSGELRIPIRFRSREAGNVMIGWAGGVGNRLDGSSSSVALSPALVKISPVAAR